VTKSVFQASQLRVQRQGRTLLDVDHIELPANRLVAVLGANGAGKSTLLKALAGFIPAEGEVRFFGQLWQPDRHRGRHVAWVAQHGPVESALSVEEYVMLGRRPRLGLFGRAGQEDYQEVNAAIATMELEGYRERRLSNLSGGERQRASIARAIAQGTPAILLDEPTNHLDLRHQYLLMRWLSRVSETGRSVVTVLHDLGLAANHAHWLVLMNEGRVLAAGTPAEVLTEATLSQAYRCTILPEHSPSGRWQFSLDDPIAIAA